MDARAHTVLLRHGGETGRGGDPALGAQLARGLGAPAASGPRQWPDGHHGWVVRIDHGADGAAMASRCGSQRRMRGDLCAPRAGRD